MSALWAVVIVVEWTLSLVLAYLLAEKKWLDRQVRAWSYIVEANRPGKASVYRMALALTRGTPTQDDLDSCARIDRLDDLRAQR